MIFAVIWVPPAEQELAGSWLAAPDRIAVVEAANKIDELLQSKPLGIGESRESSVSRIVLIPPLGVSYEVIMDDAKVFVTGVWLVDQKD